MHFLTDVIFGALLGGASVIATVMVLTRAAERQQNQHVEDDVEQAETVPAAQLAHN